MEGIGYYWTTSTSNFEKNGLRATKWKEKKGTGCRGFGGEVLNFIRRGQISGPEPKCRRTRKRQCKEGTAQLKKGRKNFEFFLRGPRE